MRLVLLALLVATTACDRADSKRSPSPPKRTAPVERTIAVEGVHGLSGMTAAAGALLIVPERSRTLIRIDGTKVTTVPITGAPEGLDLESITYLGGQVFAFGTEGHGALQPASLSIVFGTLGSDGMRIDPSRTIGLAPKRWGIGPRRNKGIEGLCSADNTLLAGLELVISEGNARFAPLGRYDRATKTWVAHRIRLTTTTGKLSALACRPGEDGAIRALLIERHFGIARIHRVVVPAGSEPRTLEPRMLRNLDALASGRGLNFEGLAWRGDDLALVIDNHFGRVTGPSLLFEIEGAGAWP